MDFYEMDERGNSSKWHRIFRWVFFRTYVTEKNFKLAVEIFQVKQSILNDFGIDVCGGYFRALKFKSDLDRSDAASSSNL